MTLFIFDPSLSHIHGHHYEWDITIAKEAVRRGEKTIIIAHKDFNPDAPPDGIEIIPFFKHTTYDKRSVDPVLCRYDDFCYFNDELFSELLELPREQLSFSDAVLVPTVTENHALAFVSWIKSFDISFAPLFIIHLMFPPGIVPADDGSPEVYDEQQALFYKLALRKAAEPGTPIYFFGGGHQIAQQFSALAGRTVEPHGRPICPTRRFNDAPKPYSAKSVLLYAGDAKVNKGILMVPELVRRLCPAYPGLEFVVHADSGIGDHDIQELCNILKALADEFSNFVYHQGRLDAPAYYAVVSSADCIISTYDPITYAHKSSGVAWEAIALGTPLLAPADCWISREMETWDAPIRTFSPYTVDAICEAFPAFVSHFPDLLAQATEGAKRFHAENGVEVMMDQIARLWVPRIMEARLGREPASVRLPLEMMRGDGWHQPEMRDGTCLRWTGKSVEISFAWSFRYPWELLIRVEQFVGSEQLEKAEAFVGETPLRVHYTITESRGELFVQGISGSRATPDVTVTLGLPWTFRPEHESRDLGILISGVTVSPAQRQRPNERSPVGYTELLSTPIMNAEKTGFLLSGIVSGSTIIEPSYPARFRFVIKSEGAPDLIRGIRLFVNGVQSRLTIAGCGIDTWEAFAHCSVDVLLSRGIQADWDLMAEHDGHYIWIEDFQVLSLAPIDGTEYRETGPLQAVESAHEEEGASRLPSSVVLDARSHLEDDAGFHLAEHYGGADGYPVRWTGPTPSFYFNVLINRRRPLALRLRYIRLFVGDRHDLIRCVVNGEDVPLKVVEVDGAFELRGVVPSSRGPDTTTQFMFICPDVMSPAEIEGDPDKRRLGLLFRWFRLDQYDAADGSGLGADSDESARRNAHETDRRFRVVGARGLSAFIDP